MVAGYVDQLEVEFCAKLPRKIEQRFCDLGADFDQASLKDSSSQLNLLREEVTSDSPSVVLPT